MSKKELGVTEKLRLLFDLQQIDSKIDEIKVLKGELPMEVSDLEDEIAGLQTRIIKNESQLEVSDQEIKMHSNNIKEAELLISKYEKQLDKVKNNREFDALNKEIGMQKLEIELSQKYIKKQNLIIEEKTDAMKASISKRDSVEKELDRKKVELTNIISKTEKEEERLNNQSEKAQKKIEDRLLKAYQKIRNAYRNGLAVVSVERNSCGGCFNQIPPQTQMEIGLSKKILVCEHCGRILVDQATILENQEA